MSKCLICQSGTTAPYTQENWSFWGEVYSLLLCQTCGSVWTSPMPSDETLAQLYDSCFDYRWYEDHYGAKYRDCERRVEELKPLLGKSVLDFGGGVGYFSRALKSKGYTAATFDPFCRKGDRVDGGWQTVVALHVLEHANDPDRTVKQMKELLDPSGNLIIAVPNAAGKGYRERGVRWVWAQPPLLHTIHFTPAGLKALLERNGLSVVQTTFAERWDANLHADLEKADFYHSLDCLWHKQPYNRSKLYRKFCATLSSTMRFRGLAKALSKNHVPEFELSELQVVARYT